MSRRDYDPSDRPCEICGKPNAPKHWSYISGARFTGPFMYACFDCFEAVFAGEN